VHGMCPYDYFFFPAPHWRIPIHRTDVGTLILADLIWTKGCISVKDEDGLASMSGRSSTNQSPRPERTGMGIRPGRDAWPMFREILQDLPLRFSCFSEKNNYNLIDC